MNDRDSFDTDVADQVQYSSPKVIPINEEDDADVKIFDSYEKNSGIFIFYDYIRCWRYSQWVRNNPWVHI